MSRFRLVLLLALLGVLLSARLAGAGEEGWSDVREPLADALELDACKRLSARELAQSALRFVLKGGIEINGSSCARELQGERFRVIEMHEWDAAPRRIWMKESDRVELLSVSELADATGLLTNVFLVRYSLVTLGTAQEGEFTFSRSLRAEEVRLYGCGYFRRLPEPSFVHASCAGQRSSTGD